MTITDQDTMVAPRRAGYLDLAGAATSGLCAMHCAVMPLLAAIPPMLGLGVLAAEGTETALMGMSGVLAAIGIGLGYRRHRSGRVVAVVAIGLGLLGLGHLAEPMGFGSLGVVAVVMGGLAVASSHLLNLRLCRPRRKVPAASRGAP